MSRRLPSFHLVRAFDAAARLQSFSRAAQALNVTPSAISHQIRELESLLGRTLFVRHHRHVELSADGRQLWHRVAEALDGLQRAFDEFGDAPQRVLAVHCAPSFAVKWLLPRLAAFREVAPEVTVRISSSADPIDLVRAVEVDLAITYGHALQRPGIAVIPLGAERIVPMCAPALLAAGVPVRDQLYTLPLIESQLSPVGWRDWLQANDIARPDLPALSFDRGSLSVSAAAGGLGVALESVRFAERELADGQLVEIGAGEFTDVRRDLHFLSQRSRDADIGRIAIFRGWLGRQGLAGC